MSARLKISLPFFLVVLLLALASCAPTPAPLVPTLTVTPPPPTHTPVPLPTSTSTPAPTPTPAYGPSIHTIQGAGHISALNGETVKDVHGVVTVVKVDGFFMQETNPDQDPATSEGLFVFTDSGPKVKIGDEVLVSGVIDEFYPGGSSTGNLSITEIKTPKVEKLAEGKALPTPVVIGRGGRVPPKEAIESNRDTFNPQSDGLDFYESMESMLVQVNDAVACGPSNNYKEVALLADRGADAGLRTPRGGIVIRENDYNPERIIMDDLLTLLPDFDTGDQFTEPLVGILDYNFGNFKFQVLKRPVYTKGNLQREVIPMAGVDELSVASFNVQNLDPMDGQKRFDDFAKVIVENLKSPDIISLDEIQDNNGAASDAVTDASDTYKMLIKAIEAAGGPKYDFRDIVPESNLDGGEPGGNIRVGFIFRTDRGIKFIDRPGGSSGAALAAKKGASGVELSFSPGRIDPQNAAFNASRKPLVGEFEYRGQKFFLIGLHLNSKGGDSPLFGRYQPPVLTSEAQRVQQAEVIAAFVKTMLALDPKAKILVLGDLNDFQFSKPLKILTDSELKDLVLTLPPEQQYSYVYDGNAQVLDQMLASPALVEILKFYNVVHVNAEFASVRRLSDHEPIVARFAFK